MAWLSHSTEHQCPCLPNISTLSCTVLVWDTVVGGRGGLHCTSHEVSLKIRYICLLLSFPNDLPTHVCAKHIQTDRHTGTYMHRLTHTNIHLHRHTHTFTHTYTHTYIYTHIYIHIYTYTHTHTHVEKIFVVTSPVF